jgi:hypothetical protein
VFVLYMWLASSYRPIFTVFCTSSLTMVVRGVACCLANLWQQGFRYFGAHDSLTLIPVRIYYAPTIAYESAA